MTNSLFEQAGEQNCHVSSKTVILCESCQCPECESCQTLGTPFRKCKEDGCSNFVCWNLDCSRCWNCQMTQYNCPVHFIGDATGCGGKRIKREERIQKEKHCNHCQAWFCDHCSTRKNLSQTAFCQKCSQLIVD